MATSPSSVRKALTAVTGAAQAEVRAVAAAASRTPQEWRAAMFAALPLIVSEYAPGSAELALDWFEELRDEARPSRAYVPTPRLNITDRDVTSMVAQVTESLRDIEQQILIEAEQMLEQLSADLEAAVQHEVASGFWDTVTENADDDPSAVGWQRFTRPSACKFCLMLADRGAVYTRTSVGFAAHTTCHCVVAPSYDPDAPKANVMQYVASQRNRSDADRARLRAYLNENFPEARG